jgi:hypothetical protein
MINESKRVNYLIQYLRKLRGMKYTLCLEEPINDGPPLWNHNKKLPSINQIYNSGSACVGLANMVRRKQNFIIPELNNKYIGGTESWYKYLMEKNRLESINYQEIYPKGTLLLQNYNSKDQGHVAIITFASKKGLIMSKIIHSVSGKFPKKVYRSCIEEKLIDYPSYSRFTHICKPENWIFKN